jgi:putative phage-type endonuclease
MKIVNLQQRTREWLQWRRNKIMASDAPIIMGVSPYKKIDKLYDEKIKCYEEPKTNYMQRGIDLEPIALRKFEEETGLIMFPAVGISDEIDWMAASFDGMTIEGDAIVEIKSPKRQDHNMAVLGNVPIHYMPQIQHQIFVSGLDFAYFYSFDGTDGVIIEVKRDQEFIEKMLDEEKAFWHCLQTFTPPQTNVKTRKKKLYGTTPIIS